jgi:2-methylcitrate dehydratase PrpD
LHLKRQPPTPYAAKFSIPYCVATALVKGRVGLEEFTAESIQQPDLLELAKKVNYELDPSLDYPRHFTGHVKIFFKDGRVIEEIQPHARGSMEAPIPPEEIQSKFRHNARLVLPSAKINGILEFLGRLENEPNVAVLGPLLTP